MLRSGNLCFCSQFFLGEEILPRASAVQLVFEDATLWPLAQHNPAVLTDCSRGKEGAASFGFEVVWGGRWKSGGLSFEPDLSTSTGRLSTSDDLLMAPNLALLRLPPQRVGGWIFPRRKELAEPSDL